MKWMLTIFPILFLTFPCLAKSDYPDGLYEVATVLDGNTFELVDGQIVRLIGIDAPKEGESCSEQAVEQLSSLISGKIVYLEKDISETDEDNKLLRYVYIDGVLVNLKLVDEGYAYAVESPPDVAQASQLSQAEDNAADSGNGCLWSSDCDVCDGCCTSSGGSWCFISMATNGSFMEPYVNMLREFRERFFRSNTIGKHFIHLYNTCSPPIADLMAKHGSVKKMVQWLLIPVVGASWVALKFGLVVILSIMLGCAMGWIALLKFGKKRVKLRFRKKPDSKEGTRPAESRGRSPAGF